MYKLVFTLLSMVLLPYLAGNIFHLVAFFLYISFIHRCRGPQLSMTLCTIEVINGLHLHLFISFPDLRVNLYDI